MGEVILVGAFHETIELCESAGLRVVGAFDAQLHGEHFGIPILGDDAYARQEAERYRHIPLILTPDLGRVRERLARDYAAIGYRFQTVVSPAARVSRFATLEEGALIQADAHVSAGARIGRLAKLNNYANAMHDVSVADFATIAPNAVLLGKVAIGARAYIGANATVLPSRVVGADAVVGAGAVVTRDVVEATTVAGNPARPLRR